MVTVIRHCYSSRVGYDSLMNQGAPTTSDRVAGCVERVGGDVAAVGQPAFGVDCCGASGAGSGDRLTVRVIDQVTGSEDAVDGGRGGTGERRARIRRRRDRPGP